MHHGNIPRMLATIGLLSPADRAAFPKRPTLYEYEKRYNWKDRYRRMEKAVLDELNSSVALEYQRLNQMAGLAVRGTMLHMVKAIQSGREEDLRIFNGKMLNDFWKMQRVERGLPTGISEEESKRIQRSYHTERSSKTSEEYFRSHGLEKVWNFIKSKPPNYFLQVMAQLVGSEEAAHEMLRSSR